MAIMKVIEILAQSDKNWEDAAQQAINEAGRSVRNIKSVYVENLQAVMDGGKVNYRLDAKISFQVEPEHKKNGAR